MLILAIRTDKPEAELGLFDDSKEVKYEVWMAHRELAETIHKKIQRLLNEQGKELNHIEAIVVFKGPGSFTGLRIGITVANALANSLRVPIVSVTGDDWIKSGIARLQNGDNEVLAVPEYGSEPNITQPKH